VFLRARLDNYDPARMTISAEEHYRLLERMKKKDVLGSIEILRNHIHRARDHVIKCLTQEELGDVG
jgi:DNA-binding GntR family transcriptional regulator